MNSIATTMVLVPGLIALLLCSVFTYLHEQSRRPYFRAWQLAWAAYTLYYALDAVSIFEGSSTALSLVSSLFLLAMGMCLLVSSRLIRDRSGLHWSDGFVGLAGVVLALWNAAPWLVGRFLHSVGLPSVPLRLEIGLAALFGYSAFSFYREARRRSSVALSLLAFALALWAGLLSFGQFQGIFRENFWRRRVSAWPSAADAAGNRHGHGAV